MPHSMHLKFPSLMEWWFLFSIQRVFCCKCFLSLFVKKINGALYKFMLSGEITLATHSFTRVSPSEAHVAGPATS